MLILRVMNVLLNSPTTVDVSGDVGGGNINVGGDEHGDRLY